MGLVYLDYSITNKTTKSAILSTVYLSESAQQYVRTSITTLACVSAVHLLPLHSGHIPNPLPQQPGVIRVADIPGVFLVGVPNLPKCRVPVLRSYINYRSVGYRYWNRRRWVGEINELMT